MKAMLWAGPAVMVLGVVSLCAPILRHGREGLKSSGRTISLGARHSELVPPIAASVMILSGAGLILAAKKRA